MLDFNDIGDVSFNYVKEYAILQFWRTGRAGGGSLAIFQARQLRGAASFNPAVERTATAGHSRCSPLILSPLAERPRPAFAVAYLLFVRRITRAL